MKNFVVILILTSTLLIAESHPSQFLNGNETTVNIDAEKAPDFTLFTLTGEEVKLTNYKDKIVILDFWATWCGPCRRGIPDLVSIQKEYKDDVIVIGISLDQQSTQHKIQSFIDHFGINYPIVLGTIDVVVAYGNIQAIPTSFVIDTRGNIVKKHVGLVPKETIVKEITSLLKQE